MDRNHNPSVIGSTPVAAIHFNRDLRSISSKFFSVKYLFIKRHDFGLELDSGIQQQAENFLRQVGITSKLSDMSFQYLAKLMKLYVSSKKYIILAEKLKQLPASHILKGVFNEAAELHNFRIHLLEPLEDKTRFLNRMNRRARLLSLLSFSPVLRIPEK